jgi:hypothetical protein
MNAQDIESHVNTGLPVIISITSYRGAIIPAKDIKIDVENNIVHINGDNWPWFSINSICALLESDDIKQVNNEQWPYNFALTVKREEESYSKVKERLMTAPAWYENIAPNHV